MLVVPLLSRRPWLRSRVLHSRLARTVLVILTFFTILDLLLIARTPPTPDSQSRVQSFNKEKIFIASTHWNTEHILRTHWSSAIVNLAKHLGPDNVYISIYESGSYDNTKGALRLLDQELEELGIQRTVVLDETTHAEVLAKVPSSSGWIETPRGKTELRRIPYLAKLRNLSLKPLADLALNGVKFDKILFLNDVVFTTTDVVNLLHTREGNYAAACALDFSKAPHYYDTFALRDVEGNEPVTSTYPYFRSRTSRQAVRANRPVPVQSCWNGMAIFDASPFYPSGGEPSPLRFRGISDSLAKYHVEASECCLVHADNPLTATRGVWLNPNVRVGYSQAAYEAVHPPPGPSSSSSEEGGGVWPPVGQRIKGIWANRLRRWTTGTVLQRWRIGRRVRAWEGEGPSGGAYEAGVECLINEMQVLVANGWAHV